MPQVQVIQPIQQQPKRLRVAAYARVSTKSNEQLHSMSVQTEYYEDLIQKNPNWEFVGVYLWHEYQAQSRTKPPYGRLPSGHD